MGIIAWQRCDQTSWSANNNTGSKHSDWLAMGVLCSFVRSQENGLTRFIKLFVVAITLLSCVGCDQATKALAKEYLPRHEVISCAGGTLRLQYVENRGVFLSLGSTLPEKARSVLLTFGIVVVIFGILAYLVFSPATPLPTTIALSLVAGGGLSNLIDRLAYGGYVVDFLNVGLGALRTGIFNVADVALMLGTALLIFRNLKHERRGF